jgi:glycosyltransferase involved in cell wall biosynthesis
MWSLSRRRFSFPYRREHRPSAQASPGGGALGDASRPANPGALMSGLRYFGSSGDPAPNAVRERLPRATDMLGRVRLAIVTSHPIQYAAPLYAHLSRDPALDITVLYCSDFSLRGARDPGFDRAVAWDIDLLGGYRSVFLGERHRTRSVAGFWSLVCPELAWEIRKSRYDVLWVHGQQFAAYVLAFALAKLQRIPVMTRGDTHLGLPRSSLRRALRHRLLGTQYRFVERFLAVGSKNREYYRALGVPDERIFSVPFSVDNARFARASVLSEAERRARRHSFGVDDQRPVVLYASKLTRSKHPDDLLRAASLLLGRGCQIHVVVAGSGVLEAELRCLAAELALGERVSFIGFVNQSSLPELFASCDVFVLPSENEPWGLVVNEAMCAGLPVVVAEGVGCVPDLVEQGVNGFTCEADNPESLARALEPLLLDAELRRRMGEASRRLIATWDYERCRLGVRAALAGLGLGVA